MVPVGVTSTAMRVVYCCGWLIQCDTYFTGGKSYSMEADKLKYAHVSSCDMTIPGLSGIMGP
jgi:hypothetical protein